MPSKKPERRQVVKRKVTEAEGGLELIKKLAAEASHSLAIEEEYSEAGIPFLFGSDDQLAKVLIWQPKLIWAVVKHLEPDPFFTSRLHLRSRLESKIHQFRSSNKLPPWELQNILSRSWTHESMWYARFDLDRFIKNYKMAELETDPFCMYDSFYCYCRNTILNILLRNPMQCPTEASEYLSTLTAKGKQKKCVDEITDDLKKLLEDEGLRTYNVIAWLIERNIEPWFKTKNHHIMVLCEPSTIPTELTWAQTDYEVAIGLVCEAFGREPRVPIPQPPQLTKPHLELLEEIRGSDWDWDWEEEEGA